MTLETIRKAIDYYLANGSSEWPYWISIIALVISIGSVFVTIWIYKKQEDGAAYTYLANLWNDILAISFENPKFQDIVQTEHYYQNFSREESLKYDAYCHRMWGYIEDIIEKGYDKNKQFEPVIRWVTAYHYTWLQRNPVSFKIKKFWSKIEEVKDIPDLVYTYRRLPTVEGGDDVDWDIVSKDYHGYILGPFAPEMVSKDGVGKRRNLLINYIDGIDADNLKKMSVADFGSGPGNLIPHLAGSVGKITCVDQSKVALDYAKILAENSGISLSTVHSDILNLSEIKRYDLVISVNSILPKTRDDVVPMLRKVRNCLKPSGKFLAVLPSFDTVEHLIDLWDKHYTGEACDRGFIERVKKALQVTKKMNRDALSYADDGCHEQCYHNLESIEREFAMAGLKLLDKPRKVRYPWELTKRFDYGYFTNEKEEIWDWFVVAEKSN